MDDCLSVCNQLRAAAALLERDLSASLTDIDVSHCQSLILLSVSEQSLSMSALSRILCCHKSNITQVVDGLVKKGLIERETSDIDRRMCELTLTPRGKRVVHTLEKLLTQRAGRCMAVFSDDEQRMLSVLLKKYVQRVGV